VIWKREDVGTGKEGKEKKEERKRER